MTAEHDENGNLLEAARRYLRRGWMPVYVPPGVKGPTHKGWQRQRLTEADLPAHFDRPGNIGIILGEASGGLVDVDLDCEEAVELADRFLPRTDAVTGRPGARRSHRWYVSDVAATKHFRDPKTNKMVVELRSTGGQTLVGPSIHETGEPYDALEGDPAQVPAPMLTACVEALYEEIVRRRHGELPTETKAPPPQRAQPVELDEGTLHSRARAYLDAMPSAISGNGGHSTTYAAATALVHGFCIPPDQALRMLLEHYNPRCQPLWTEKELEHKVEDAAAKDHDMPRGWLRDQQIESPEPAGVDLSGIIGPTDDDASECEDPGLLPESLLGVPGFITEVMDFTLDTAPYPNPVLAFACALGLQGFLAGRKVRDPANNRTNLYLLALANSGTGKEHPRKVNQRILMEVGLQDCVGDAFASGEGIEDRLYAQPSMLFQTDEIDAVIVAMKEGKEQRYEGIMQMLLKMFTSSNGLYPMRVKAGKEHKVIDQPSLCIFGTAIPKHYYEALSVQMLTNGFFARMLILETGKRAEGQEPVSRDLPDSIVETARWWANFRPGTGNLENWHPIPRAVDYTPAAQDLLGAFRRDSDREYTEAEADQDTVAMTIWARAGQKARRLALIYACSENHENPTVSEDAVTWASEFVRHQTQRMLFMAYGHVAENPFHAECLKVLEKLRDASSHELDHSTLLKRMKMDARSFRDLIETLHERGDIGMRREPTAGRTATYYHLAPGRHREERGTTSGEGERAARCHSISR